MIEGTASRPPVPPLPADPGGYGPGAVRLCRDCRHVRPAYNFVGMTLGLSRDGWRNAAKFAQCGHPSSVREHTDERAADWIVTGEPSPQPETSRFHCSTMRGSTGSDYYGPEGRFWEPWPAGAPPGWRDPAPRRELARAALSTWKYLLGGMAVGLGTGVLSLLLAWALR